MEIKKTTVLVRDLVDGYRDSDEEGVVGYHGKLDIRPSINASSSMTRNKRKLLLTPFQKAIR